MKNLLIVDGNSILNRAYYGIRPLTTKEGIPTNAVYGMMTILKKHLDNIKPDYAVIAFDLKAKTFRHKACDFYKAQRKPMPEDLAAQLPYAKECVDYLGFNVVELEGYEADDILGTVSRMTNDDVHSYILTGDRDSLQLINENTSVILVKTKEDVVYNTEKFVNEYGITPTQFIDVKAIMGDSSDNIPGVAGIGEKGAFKLILEYGSLESLYESYASSSLSQGMKQKLENGREMAFTSKFLATIVLDAPIGKALCDFEYLGIKVQKLRNIFNKLEFSALIKKFSLDVLDAPIFNQEAEETPCTSVQKAEVVYSAPKSIDSSVLAIYPLGDKVYFYGENDICYCTSAEEAKEYLKNNPVICHDVKSLLSNFEINCAFDTMLAGYVISPSDSTYDLSYLSVHYLDTVFEEENGAKIIYMLYREMTDRLSKDKTLHILTDIEIPLAYVLFSMEKEGFRVDTDGLSKYSRYLLDMADTLKERIYMLSGEEFNINSPKQLGEVLFEKLNLPHGKKTKTGYSTSVEVLEGLADKYEIVSEVLEYRKVMKLNSTYCEGLTRLADESGRVHTTFNQTVTVTGRLSSTEPNLQNIPIRTELGKAMRKYFVTKSDDYVLVDADYSQIELKVLAHMSKDANMIYAFNSGADIHTMTASQVFGVSPEYVTPELRKQAKAVNFGIVYGIGSFSLSKDLHISNKEAKQYIDSYFATYPDVHRFISSLIDDARATGYAKTMFGRIRYIPELASSNKNIQAFGERAAMNSPIQGTAADIIKIAMINVHKALKDAEIDAKLILQVHDELIIESHRNCAEKAYNILKTEMEKAIALLVPLTADVAIGDNWLDAK